MVVNINGSLDTSGVSGSASSIDVWSIARGDVSQVDISESKFSMAGMEFSTDAATSFEGIANLAAISVGTSLTVWGEQTSADAHSWRATRVKFLSFTPTRIVSTGLFKASTQKLNDIQLRDISGSYLIGLGDQLLRVEGDFDAGTNVLDVRSTPIAIAAAQQTASGLVEIEAVVTAFTSSTDFYIGTTRVDASKAPVNSGVALNSSVEVTGSMQSGVLLATKVEIKGGNLRAQIDITGVVESFTSLSDFEVRGQKCDASNASVIGMLANLRNGIKVRVAGASGGHETLMVQSISIGVN
jgi:hypothetical protein